MDDEACYVPTWLKLEELYKKGDKIKAIGVSNFNESQLNELLTKASVVPQMHQIEIHGYENMAEMVKFCQGKKIQVTAYSPLGNPGRPAGLQKGQDVLMEDAVVKEVAAKHGKTAAQVQLVDFWNLVAKLDLNRKFDFFLSFWLNFYFFTFFDI